MLQDLGKSDDYLALEPSRDTNFSVSVSPEPCTAGQCGEADERPSIPEFVAYCINRKSLNPRQNIVLENTYCLARVQARCLVYTMESLIYKMVKNARQQRY